MKAINMELTEKFYKELKKIPEVAEVNILSPCDSDLGLEVVISTPWSWRLAERIADAISKVSWEVFEETGEFPALEWDIVERRNDGGKP